MSKEKPPLGWSLKELLLFSGNYPLCRILTNLYEVSPEPLEGHTTALVSLLPHAEQVEKNSLFSLFEQIAGRKPEALKNCIPQLISYLCPNTSSQNTPGCMCEDILQVGASKIIQTIYLFTHALKVVGSKAFCLQHNNFINLLISCQIKFDNRY